MPTAQTAPRSKSIFRTLLLAQRGLKAVQANLYGGAAALPGLPGKPIPLLLRCQIACVGANADAAHAHPALTSGAHTGCFAAGSQEAYQAASAELDDDAEFPGLDWGGWEAIARRLGIASTVDAPVFRQASGAFSVASLAPLPEALLRLFPTTLGLCAIGRRSGCASPVLQNPHGQFFCQSCHACHAMPVSRLPAQTAPLPCAGCVTCAAARA